ncbi:MAG: FAD-binding oxidoreductase [Verrucomicrobiota bacterium]
MLTPVNLDELGSALAGFHQRGEKLPSLELLAFNQIIEHIPEDMTVTVESGMTLAALQSALAERGQWLPVDPPHPERLTIESLLSLDQNGPRRCGYGTVRDYLIGLKVVLADGRLIKAGGKVVKNVAGYDLCKLFVGARGTLGVIVEATFKLRPLPEAEEFVQARCEGLRPAIILIEAVLESELVPAVLDLHNIAVRDFPTISAKANRTGNVRVAVGFAGTREDVEWQVVHARDLGLSEPSSLDYETVFWEEGATPDLHRVSLLPSRLSDTVDRLGGVPFVARAGSGILYYRGGPELSKPRNPTVLAGRLKDAFDPKHILPDLPA